MKIVLTDYETISDDPGRFDPFREFGELALYDTSSEEDAAERLRDADIAVCNKTPFTRSAGFFLPVYDHGSRTV